MRALAGQRAVVIGAAGPGNMGQVIARRLAADGARLLVAGRNQAELDRLADELAGVGIACDITRQADTKALAEAAVSGLGGVDIAVKTTGWGLLKPFELTTDEELRRIVDLQFIGAFQFFQAMLGAMGQGGSLIQVSSATATIMLSDHAAYMGTKAGFDHVIRCIANDFGSRGIRANSVSPGITETPMTAGAKKIPGLWEAYQAKYPLGRTGTSEDVAAAVAWLASDECFMTGENLQVNGGLTLRGNPSREEVDASIEKRTGKPRPRAWS